MLENKLGIKTEAELALVEERTSKKRAYELFEKGILDQLEAGSFSSLSEIHKYLFDDIYLFAGKIRSVNIAKGSFLVCSYYVFRSINKKKEEIPQKDIIPEKDALMKYMNYFLNSTDDNTTAVTANMDVKIDQQY